MLMQMRRGSYTNKDAVENCIRYITRTRANEQRENELIAWGGVGVGCYASPELAIQQFCCVQKIYGIDKRGGRRVHHEVYNFMDEEFEKLGRNYEYVYQIAMKCAEYYYYMGHQVVFAIHHVRNAERENKGLHIHFVINSVNFFTGRKWHTGIQETYGRELLFGQIVRNFIEERCNPLEFSTWLI